MWWTLLADVSCRFEIRQVPNSLAMEALLRLSYSSLKVVNRQADQESMLPCIPSKLFVAAFLAFLSFCWHAHAGSLVRLGSAYRARAPYVLYGCGVSLVGLPRDPFCNTLMLCRPRLMQGVSRVDDMPRLPN